MTEVKVGSVVWIRVRTTSRAIVGVVTRFDEVGGARRIWMWCSDPFTGKLNDRQKWTADGTIVVLGHIDEVEW